MKLFLVMLLAFPFAALSAPLDCSIKAKSDLSEADQRLRAKVPEAAAKTTALAAARTPGATIDHGGLEVEEGCLVYTFDIRIPASKSLKEVFVDAGTGKVLRVENETAAKEAMERAADKMTK
jgi:uncharacterized membrane protein YkoI